MLEKTREKTPDTMRDRMGQIINDLIETDPQSALVLAAISANLFRDALARHPARVVNVGIMEQTAVSLAAAWRWRAFIPLCIPLHLL